MQVAAGVVHVLVERVELTYVDDLRVALLRLCHLQEQWVVIDGLWEHLSHD